MRLSLVAGVIGVSALVFVGVQSEGDAGVGDGGRVGSVVEERIGSPMDFDRTPGQRYAITYRVEGKGGSAASEQHLTVDRPWRSRSTAGGGEHLSDFGAVGLRAVDGEVAGFVAPPALAAGDMRPEIALPRAVTAGIAELGERRHVLGTVCQVYRTSLPLDAGPITAPAADRTESCVDRRGFVLEEVLFVEGEPSQRRVAVSVKSGSPIADSEVAVPASTMSIEEGGAGLRPVTEDEAAGLTRWKLPRPRGFSRQGSYAIVYPGRDSTNDPSALASRLATVATVWTRGADVVVFETGATLDGSPIDDSPAAVDVMAWPSPSGAPAPGRAQLVLDARGNELRSTEGGELVRLAATLTPDDLVALAGSISDGGGHT